MTEERPKVQLHKCVGRDALILCVILGLFAALATWAFLRSRQAVGWKTTMGRPLAADVALDHSSGYNSSGGGTVYRLHVRYEYFVDGAPYVSERWSPSAINLTATSRRVLEAKSATLRRRHHVRVYYNPSNPSDSALSRGMDCSVVEQVLLIWVVFGLFLGVTAYFTISRWREIRLVERLLSRGGYPRKNTLQ